MPRREKQFYGRKPPEVQDSNYAGKLFVVEGADGSGRSTQIEMLGELFDDFRLARRAEPERREPLPQVAVPIRHGRLP